MMKQASVLAVALLFSVQARAATVTRTGTVNVIRVHDGVTYSAVADDWIAVQGFTTTGHSCGTDTEGRVVLLIRDDQRGQRMMSLATSALLAGKNVTVTVDDTKKKSGTGFCFLQYISLNP